MKSRSVSKLKAILIATVVLAALPSVAEAAPVTVLARGAGYGNPSGSPHVELLQRRLRLVGVNPGPIDGRFGPLTEAAVRRYQLRDGLTVDGLAGPRTRTALRQAVKQVGRGAGYGTRHGSGRVRRIQRSLRLAGARPGPIDGRFGALTQAAIVRFQHGHGLAASGLAGEATREALERQLRNARAGKPRSAEPGRRTGATPAEPKPAGVSAGGGGRARPAAPRHRSAAKAPAPSGPAKAPQAATGGGGGATFARVELILFAAALLLAIMAVAGLPEKIARRVAGPPPPPAPRRVPIVEDVEPDPAGKVVDGSRRPPRPRPPAPRVRPDRGDEPERTSTYS